MFDLIVKQLSQVSFAKIQKERSVRAEKLVIRMILWTVSKSFMQINIKWKVMDD